MHLREMLLFCQHFVVTIYLMKQLFSHFSFYLDFEGFWLDMESDHVSQNFISFLTHIYFCITTCRLYEVKNKQHVEAFWNPV